jgi:dienelactone hydrolase
MRSVRFLRWIVVLIALAAIAFASRPYVRGLAFVVRAADLQGVPRRLADMTLVGAGEREIEIPTAAGPLRARVYEPSGTRRRATLLVPPLGAAGVDEPGIVRLARQLAASGVVVVTPAIPELSGFEIVPRATDAIEQAALWLASNVSLAPDGKAGLIGFGFSGGLAVVAAGRQTVASRIAYVLSVGGHHDLPRVLRYLCTGTEPRPGNQIRLKANTTDEDPGAFVRPPNVAGLAMLLGGVAPRMVPAAQVQPLRAAVLDVLARFAADGRDQPQGEHGEAARDAARRLPEPSATLIRYLADRDVVHLGARLLPHVAAYSGDAALSPARAPKPAAAVFLLHDSEDNTIPEVEAEYLAEELRGRVPVRTATSRFLPGAPPGERIGAGDALKLAGFWGDVLSR